MKKENEIAEKVIAELKVLFEDKLKKVILFGSYARGDYDGESDIDIMVLTDVERKNLRKYRPKIVQISSKTGIENDVYVSIMLNSENFFFANLKTSAFYRNVIKNGKVLYDG